MGWILDCIGERGAAVLPQSIVCPRPRQSAMGSQYSPNESRAKSIAPGLPLPGVPAKKGPGEEGMSPFSPKPLSPLDLQTRRTW